MLREKKKIQEGEARGKGKWDGKKAGRKWRKWGGREGGNFLHSKNIISYFLPGRSAFHI